MKVVLDSNVFIAAFAAHGLCHLVFENIVAHHEFLLSPELLNEVQTNLRTKIKLPDARVKEISAFLKGHSTFIKDTPVPGLVCRDPDDIKILALAINGKAEVIITGDQDLLILKKQDQVDIISPREFWDKLRVI